MKENINYKEAFTELQKIVTEIERGEISIDELLEKVKRTTVLIKICKQKLDSTEESVKKILNDLEAK